MNSIVLPPIENAKMVVEEWITFDGEKKVHMEKLFIPEEVCKAETIVKSLDGMTIASALRLLEKISQYLLLDRIR